jgi:GH25 family lysozyme M1 (1,4-beta-N-acetylmuramidase)
MRNFARAIIAVACCFSMVGVADAAQKTRFKKKTVASAPKSPPPQKNKPIPILDPDAPTSSGVSITTAPWHQDDSATSSPVHVDQTYYAFAKAHSGELGRYDFYYRLEIVPQFHQSFEHCGNEAGAYRFFNALFGTSTGALVTVKANIQHRWASSNATDLFKGDAALVLAAQGDGITGKAGTGCFFDFTSRPSFPWIQWNGGRADRDQDFYDDFQIKFTVNGGRETKSNALNTAVSLFTGASAAARWFSVANPLASPVFTAAEGLGNSFQSALVAAGTMQNQVSRIQYLNAYFPDGDAQHGRILISIPNLFGPNKDTGNLAIYVRRQASIALQGSGDITPDTIFNTSELAYRQCPMAKIASGSCEVKENPTLRTAMAAALSGIDKSLKADNPVVQLFDMSEPKAKPVKASSNTAATDANPKKDDATDEVVDRRKLVYDLCRGMRAVSILQLHLSTLDEIAIRWAFLREAGLQQYLESFKDDLKDDAKKQFESKWGHSLSEMKQQCWNDGDRRLLTMTANGLTRHLEGSDAGAEASSMGRLASEEGKKLPNLAAAAPDAQPFVLNDGARAAFNGTFGIDLSHYEIDADKTSSECRSEPGYSTAKCSCQVNWNDLAASGVRFVYYQNTVGGKPADLSAKKIWRELESLHKNKKLFRGAYHFLLPNPEGVPPTDASLQASNFLESVGAIDGKKPVQLSPALDMEGTKTPVAKDSDAYNACPKPFLRQEGEKFTCDMWYKVKAEDIVALAQNWIRAVEKATGKTVSIYTNKDDWWDDVLGKTRTSEQLLKNRSIWIARYSKNAPKPDPRWTGTGVKWGMPPLPSVASYPSDAYSTAHFWQFTEGGKFQVGSNGTVQNGITCKGQPFENGIDFNYTPVSGAEFDRLFGTSDSEVASAASAK